MWLAEPTRLQAMGRAARQVAEQHSWANMADAYLHLYACAAARREAGRASSLSNRDAEPQRKRKAATP